MRKTFFYENRIKSEEIVWNNVREWPKVRFGRTFTLCRKVLPLLFVRKSGRSSAEPKVRSITSLEKPF